MWPTEATTSKSLPRYFLMVLAFAGDSTMTRFLLMVPKKRDRGPDGRGPLNYIDATRGRRVSMHCVGWPLENEVLHALIGLFLAWLAKQHHQNHPFHLLDLDFLGFKGQKAVSPFQ